jgi:tripartite-type tricarboxylate transporter receptor subunit TctC
MHMTRALAALFVMLTSAVPLMAIAEPSWPSKPVRLIVPYPTGGSFDPLARLLAVKLSEATGVTFYVENIAGASGSIGTAAVARAAPDGYTFGFIGDAHSVNPWLIKQMPFDTLNGLAPVMLIGTAPMVIATNPTRPYQSMSDVVSKAKAKTNPISYGSSGYGSLGHLTMALLQREGKFSFVHVPYKGTGPMIQDLVGGHIDLDIGSLPAIAPMVKNGQHRAIAVTGEKRASSMPEVATLAEIGFPGLSALMWWGIVAPPGTPKPIVERFHATLAKTLAEPSVTNHLVSTFGMEIRASNPEELQLWIKNQMDLWGKTIKENNIQRD